jgi:hypothetical protein
VRILTIAAAVLYSVDADVGGVQSSAQGADGVSTESAKTLNVETGGYATEPAAASGEQTAAGQKILELEQRVAAIEAALAAPKTPPAPIGPAHVTQGRIVIVRGHRGNEPAIVTEVREDGSIDAQVFRCDHLVHTAEGAKQIDPSDDDAIGWFWPPRA